ncbi:lipid A deacylase LpxR family protein [Prosthecobacter sp.]|uniref:lipid A deacylase LpxR family protein n=1 Tax=Prosthecobacter sp. TaxID=1965333 RepID=UPI002ABA29AC|nr:lipid A deacylase LpxR family protein [Prosthecobacter sp.]MDZ4401183.1 lipid A deacylase LpxR family protein [Prosthecobacter sp.]
MKTLPLLLATLALPCLMHGQTVDPTRLGTFTMYFENDVFAATDENYTNGVRFSWTSPDLRRFGDDASTGGVAGFFDDIGWMGDSSYERNVAVSIGQSMYTPTDVHNPALVVNERPYAGWLYMGFGLVWKNPRVKNTLLFNIGVVGPWSFAEETQRALHDAMGNRSPAGWDNQLDNELGINVSYERMWRIRDRRGHGLDWDFLPYAGVTLGNVNTHATLGAEFRFGCNLPDDFGTGAISESATTPTAIEDPYASKAWVRRFGMHLFARAEGRAVARNIFLDGNTFGNSHSVDKENFVADLSAGLAMNWRNTKISYAFVYRTREYEGQPNGQLFGSITLSFNF